MKKYKIVNEYLLLELAINKELSPEERNMIALLEKDFPRKDFYFELKKKKIRLFLKALDLEAFKHIVNKLANEYNLNNQHFLFKLINKIEDIRSFGISRGKRIYVDFSDARKVRERNKKIHERGKYFYAIDHSFSQENNDVPAEFTNEIICGDSAQILHQLPENSIDLIVTSPPYNFGLDYDSISDGVNWNKYFEKLFSIFSECIRVLKFGGRIIVNVQPLFSDYIPIHHIISNFFMNNKLIWKGEILWEKHNYNCKYTAWGSWKSPSNPYFKYSWEFLEIFAKGTLKKGGKKEDIDINAEEFKKWVYAKWDIPPEKNMKRYDHPAVFPEELVRRVLKLFSFKSDFILDPFNGVGTTTLVAKKLERRFLGIDVSEKYCKIALKRLEIE